MTIVGTSIINPTIRDIRQSESMPELWYVELGPSVTMGASLDELRDLARTLVDKLDEAAENSRVASAHGDRQTVEVDASQLGVGVEVFTRKHGWVRTVDTGKGTCHRWDLMGDSEVLTSRGTVYFKAGEKALVAVPECEGSVMERAS